MQIDYPNSDGAFATLVAGGEAASTGPITLDVARSWSNPPAVARHEVVYQLSNTPAPALLVHLDGITINLDAPIKLIPVEIPKPWGREIWYSGIEARGESQVAGDGGECPLLTYLSLAPARLCQRQNLVLLKILAPTADPLRGELYFESHTEKREVYVVTHVDEDLYPDGVGAIRLGMNQQLRADYGDDAAFRAAFLDSVRRYEAARQTADAADEPIGHTAEEAEARRQAAQFTALQPLRIGDVVALPTLTPHALQPGVRVVELQTPVYERQIIWSSQKVLTQEGWDSTEAIAAINLDPPSPVTPRLFDPDCRILAEFADFAVWRVHLAVADRSQAPRDWHLPDQLPYALCIVISGQLELGLPHSTLRLVAEEAAFVPASAITARFEAVGEDCVFLVAAPAL